MAKRVATLSESWLSGFPDRPDVVEPAILAQQALAGWTEDRCRRAWTDVQGAVNQYRQDLLAKGQKPRGDTWRWYNADALTPGQPLANPSDFLGLLLDGIAEEHGALRPTLNDYGAKAVLAITVLAIAADLPVDDSHDLYHADWVEAAVVSCWRGSFYLQRADDTHPGASEETLQDSLKRARSELGRLAARGRHTPRDKVYEEAMRQYAAMDPALPMAEAARRIQRAIRPFADEVGYRTTAGDPSATIYKWIRARRKSRQKT
jgi:hypothetical protein